MPASARCSRSLSSDANRWASPSRGTGSSRPPTATEMRPRLLADDQQHRVGLLAQAQRRPVAHSHVDAGRLRRLAERQLAGGGGDAARTEDHGAVVQRAALGEDGPEQRRRHLGVHGFAGMHVGGQRHLPLDGDQGADALARQGGGGVGQLVRDGMVRVVAEKPPDAVTAQHHQAAPQFRLENDHQAHQHDGQQVVEDVAEDGQVEADDGDLGDQEQRDHDEAEAAHQSGAARLAQQAQGDEDGQGEDADLHQIVHARGFVELGQAFLQRSASLRSPPHRARCRCRSASNRRTASRVSAASCTRKTWAAPCARA